MSASKFRMEDSSGLSVRLSSLKENGDSYRKEKKLKVSSSVLFWKLGLLFHKKTFKLLGSN